MNNKKEQNNNKEQQDKKKEIGYIKPREITDEMKESYLDYAMSVIVSRALPDVRDGLKPVHRRILYAMYEDGLRHNVKFRKSATIVGACLGRYHPHGDTAVYDSLVRMAQDFSYRYPLIQGQGNFGSIDGDASASMRYTEARLSSIGEDMLKDIEKDTVNFGPNYDDTRKEPLVLPSPAPQLLLNGSFGIAVGMTTNIPPHNISEVLQACIYLIDNPDADTEDLFQFVKGPDFPTGGIIFGKKDIISAYSQGKGAILCRGKAEIEEEKRIIISEIPFMVQKSDLIKEFAKLIEEKRIEGIKNIRDESDREGMRIVIDLKREVLPQKILNALYKYSALQKTFHLNMLALVDGIQPKILCLSEVLNLYLSHKKEVVLRRTKFDLERAKERAHILDGLMIALANIDKVIKIIKKSEDREDAKNNLIKSFKLTERQVIAILEMKLQNLAKLETAKIEKELKELKQKIKELNLILNNPEKLKELIKKELQETQEKYQDKRKTKVVALKPGEIGQEELILKAETIIILTREGFIKRMKPSLYKTQKRGGKGIIGLDINEEDMVEHFLIANTLSKLLFFTDSGKVFQCQVWEIPEMSRTAKGRGLLNFLEVSSTEKILSLISYSKEDEREQEYLVLVTRNGIIKKTELQAFQNVRKNGLTAIRLGKEDSLCAAKLINKDKEIILLTRKGKAIRFKENNIRSMSRIAVGVKGIRLGKGDEVIGVDVIESQNYLLVITENGYGKRVKQNEFKIQRRGGSGVKAGNVTNKTGEIVFSKIIDKEQKELIVVSKKGQVIRISIDSISIISRIASGVRIMKLGKEDKVATAICL